MSHISYNLASDYKMPSIQPLLAWYSTFTLFNSFLFTKGFKFKFGSV